ncbi:hypothetical protein E2C01_036787 [Portunus trituberculatus]|uniref:Uncharacterized protein n=1 Tax=Portunus trituberculatus TaxID=210409 RepID=A0A5B7FD10_PORTR|nr:hypothetical protein [Portunus trituberculatus]
MWAASLPAVCSEAGHLNSVTALLACPRKLQPTHSATGIFRHTQTSVVFLNNNATLPAMVVLHSSLRRELCLLCGECRTAVVGVAR